MILIECELLDHILKYLFNKHWLLMKWMQRDSSLLEVFINQKNSLDSTLKKKSQLECKLLFPRLKPSVNAIDNNVQCYKKRDSCYDASKIVEFFHSNRSVRFYHWILLSTVTPIGFFFLFFCVWMRLKTGITERSKIEFQENKNPRLIQQLYNDKKYKTKHSYK